MDVLTFRQQKEDFLRVYQAFWAYTFWVRLGSSYYKENSIEWCDKAWRRMRNAERGEARLYQIGDKVYRQLYVVLEDGMEGYFTDINDRGCSTDNLHLKREARKELERVGPIVIKKYRY